MEGKPSAAIMIAKAPEDLDKVSRRKPLHPKLEKGRMRDLVEGTVYSPPQSSSYRTLLPPPDLYTTKITSTV